MSAPATGATPALNATALGVFVFFFALVTVVGFFAARWRRGDLTHLHEWGLGGRRFGSFVTWFLLGGDLYTAYTLIAVPALVFAVGAYGFFALPYCILTYPIVFLTFPRLWNVCRKHGWITSADFVEGRYGSRGLALAVAVTGVLATMPYIALQLVGLEVVFEAMGLSAMGIGRETPLVIAFLVLAIYTYSSGLRAPALIAFVKDAMLYITIIAAVVIIPIHLAATAPCSRARSTRSRRRAAPAACCSSPVSTFPSPPSHSAPRSRSSCIRTPPPPRSARRAPP